jgi:spore germination cell wall hydrolase CwlJ-like protein
MKHGLCARGIAAVSLAFAATTASAAPPVAVYANAMPVVASPARFSAALIADSTETNPASAVAAPDIPSWFAQRAAKAASEAKPTSGSSVDQPLDELVRDHAAVVVTGEEERCLAGAVYFEARGESLEGQLAVAEVVLNRAASGEYPASICEVVKQPAQFSFVRNGLFPPIDESCVAWRTAVGVAHIADEKLADELASDVLWYHADYVAPAWGRRLARVTQIGAHIFYRRG